MTPLSNPKVLAIRYDIPYQLHHLPTPSRQYTFAGCQPCSYSICIASERILQTPPPTQEAKRSLVDLMLRAATVQLSLASLRSGLAAAEAIGGVDEAVVSAATVVMQQMVRLHRSLCHSVYTYLYPSVPRK